MQWLLPAVGAGLVVAFGFVKGLWVQRWLLERGARLPDGLLPLLGGVSGFLAVALWLR